ncbi:sulfotransferase family protein [Pontibacter sp. G13]|uniref:sulfotransferase-like domain-containing protein n=1 Tax=Pontibacter sp. G13 TaxID=3074898 RepID=UPI00288B67E5|nr:sulfotransferase family protein [Pontibacter sp. G13]WNJ17033.1 sulfotransferase family protein [Pontibacter sp. G13]
MTQTRISLWTGPRCVSSAMMYAFAQRSDTRVLDEPLYPHYLRMTGASHPSREMVMAYMETDSQKVINRQILGNSDHEVLFIKNLSHHLVGLDVSFVEQLTNVFLIRNPEDMLASLIHYIPAPRLLDTAYRMQYRLFHHLKRTGKTPLVIDAKQLLAHPEATLRLICDHAGIAFDPAMLTWNPGPIPECGVWAEQWYKETHKHAGFMPYHKSPEPLPEELQPLVDECFRYYSELYEYAVNPISEIMVHS